MDQEQYGSPQQAFPPPAAPPPPPQDDARHLSRSRSRRVPATPQLRPRQPGSRQQGRPEWLVRTLGRWNIPIWAVVLAAWIIGMLMGLAMASGNDSPRTSSAVVAPSAGDPPAADGSGASAGSAGAPSVSAAAGAAGLTVATPTAKVTKAAPFDGDGIFVVGSEIAPGRYRSASSEACYWARLSAADGSVDAIIANGIDGGSHTVTIESSDKAFETMGCGTWSPVG